jgi:predicted ribosomally synthesized peptide with SipW-like signal peptide
MFKADSRRKKVLLSMGVLAGVGALAGAGTFASFTAQTTNPGNTFADGTLVLRDTVNVGTACLSTDADGTTDVNEGEGDCEAVFDLSVKKPGDSHTANITLDNMGSLPAADLQVFGDPCVDADASGENFNGSGEPCGKAQIYIQQYSDAARTTPSACLFGGAVVALTCDFSDPAKTLDAFVTASGTGGGLSAGTLTAATGAATTDTRWFKIGVKLPQDADNTFQGRSASLDLNWHLTQTAGTVTP